MWYICSENEYFTPHDDVHHDATVYLITNITDHPTTVNLTLPH